MLRAMYGLIGIVMLFLQTSAVAATASFTEIRDEFNQISGILLPQPQHFSTAADVVELDYSDFTILRIQQQQSYFFILNKNDVPLRLLAEDPSNRALDGVDLRDALLIVASNKGKIDLLNLPQTILRKIQQLHIHLDDTLEINSGIYLAAQLNAKKNSAVEDLFYSQLLSKQQYPNISGYFSIFRLGDIIKQKQNKLNRQNDIPLDLKGSLGILHPSLFDLDYVHFLQPATFRITKENGHETVIATVPATMYVYTQTVKYDLDFSLEDNNDRLTTRISGRSSDSIQVSDWQIELSALTVKEELTQKKQELVLSGIANLAGQNIDVKINHDHGGYNDAVYELNMQKVPLHYFLNGKIKDKLGSIETEHIIIKQTQLIAHIVYNNKKIVMHIVRDQLNNETILFENPEISIGKTFHAGSSLLDELKLTSSIVIYHEGNQQKIIDLNKIGFDQEMVDKIKTLSGRQNSLNLSSGFTLFGVIHGSLPDTDTRLQSLGLGDDGRLISGTINKAAMYELITDTTSDRSDLAYNLAADLPDFSMQGLPNGNAFQHSRLVLSRDANTATVSIDTTLALLLNGEHLQLNGQINLGRADAQNTSNNTATGGLLFEGKLIGSSWPAALGIHWMQLKNVRGHYRESSVSPSDQKDAQQGLHILAEINLEGHNTMPLNLRFTQIQDSFRNAIAEFGGENVTIDLSYFPHLAHITSVSQLMIRNLQLSVSGRGDDRILAYSAIVNNPEQVIQHPGLKLSGQTLLKVLEKPDHHWDIIIDGAATLNNKQVQYHAELDTLHPDIDDHFLVSLSTPANEQKHLSLADILGSNNKPLQAVYPNSVTVKNGYIEADILAAKDEIIKVVSFNVNDNKVIAIIPSNAFSLDSTAEENDWIRNGVSFNQFIGFLSDQELTIEYSELPQKITSLLDNKINKNISLQKNTTNVIGSIQVNNNSTALQTLQTIGITNEIIHLSGQMDLQMFLHAARFPSINITDTIRETVKLEGSIPAPIIPGFDTKTWLFEEVMLKIGSSDQISGNFSLIIGNETLHGNGYFSLNSITQDQSVNFNGKMLSGWQFPQKNPVIHFDDFEVMATIEENNHKINFHSNVLLDGDKHSMLGKAEINNKKIDRVRFYFADSNTTMPLERIKLFQGLNHDNKISINKVGIDINFNDPLLKISGQIKKAQITDFPGLSIREGDLSMIVYGHGASSSNQWSGEISNGTLVLPGTSTIASFKASVSSNDNRAGADSMPSFSIHLEGDHKIADLLNSSIHFSGFEETPLSSVDIINDSAMVTFDHDGSELEARIFYPKKAIPVVSFDMGSFPIKKVIPDSEIFDGAEINKTWVIVAPDEMKNANIKIDVNQGFSKLITEKVASIDYEDIKLISGANLFAVLETKHSKLNNIFNSLGISDNLDLVGSFDPSLLFSNPDETTPYVDLKAIIKVISIPGIPSGSKIKNSYFRINGDKNRSESGKYIGIHSELDLKVNRELLSFAGDFDFSGDRAEQKIQFIGELKNSWRPINWMQFDDIQIKASFDHNQENTDAKITLTGDGYIKTKMFNLEIDLVVVENQLNKMNFNIKGNNLAIADIEPLESIPRADKIQLSEIYFELDPQSKETHFKADLSSSDLIDFPGSSINGGTFYADKTADGWDVGIKDGKITIHDNPLSYSAEVNEAEIDGKSVVDFIFSLNGELSLQQLLGPSVNISSDLQDVALESIEITRHSADIAFKFKKTNFEANIYKPENKKPHISLTVDDFSLDELIPNAEILSGVDIEKAALVIIFDKSVEENSIDFDQVPEHVKEQIKSIDGNISSLKPGINIFAAIDIKSDSQLEKFFDTVGISSKSGSHHLEMEGSFDPNLMFNKENNTGSKLKQFLKTVDLYANIDDVELKGLPSGSEFTNTNFHISGSGGSDIHGQQREGFFVGIASDLDLVIGGDEHKFKGRFDFIEKNHETEIEFSGFTEINWHAPLGLSWITLKSLGISATIDKKKYDDQDETDFNLDISAKSKLGEKEIDIDVVINQSSFKNTKNNALSNHQNDRKGHFEVYLDVKTDITAADIPILKNIPNASGFGLTEVIFARDGIVAKTVLNNVEVDAAAIQVPVAGSRGNSGEENEEDESDSQGRGKAWLFIVEQQDGSLFEFIPGLGDVPLLKQIHMKEVFFAIATKNIRINSVEDLPIFAHDIFKPILDVQSSGFHLVEGIGIGAVFNPLEGNSDFANVLGQVGISGESMIVGEIGGIFGGQPSLDLLADLPSLRPSTIKGMEFFNWVDGIIPRFLVHLDTEGLEVQLDIDMVVTIKNDKLSFDGGIDFDLKEDEIGLEIFGDFRGVNGGSDPGWHNPLGLNGLTIEQLTLDCGFEEGALEFGLAGAIDLNDHLYKVGADFSIEFESVIPSIQGIGFNLQQDVVGPQELLDILALLSGEQLKINADQLPFLQLHDALITFATPGMSNPNLGIVGPGAAVSGKLTFLGQELGNLTGSIYPSSGIKLKGKINPFNFAILELKENHIDFALVWDQLPHLNMKSRSRVLFAEQDISIDVVPPKYAKFDLKDSLGHFGEAEIKADMYGIDFSSGRLLDHADVYLYGDIRHSDFFEWLEKTAKVKIDNVMNTVHKGITDAEKKVNETQAKVNELNTRIEKARAIVRAERQQTLNWVNAAETNVQHLQDLINTAEYNVNHCPWYAFWCFAYWGGEIVGLEIAYGVAEGVLQGIRLGATLIPIDLDPRVSVLIVAHDSATLVLRLATLSLEGFDALDRVAKNIIDGLIDESYKLFGDTKINDLSFKGSLLGYAKHREPWFSNIDMELGGQPLQEKILFKPSLDDNDVAFNIEQVVPISLHAIQVVLHAIENKIPVQFLGRILDEISNEINKAEKDIKRIFSQHKFELGALQKEQHAMETRSSEQVKLMHGKLTTTSDMLLMNWKSKITTITDLQKDSDHFRQKLIEVGHSGHCLKRSKNGLSVQHGECSTTDPNQKWSTLDWGAGYAAIQVFQRCLKPIVSTSNAKYVKLILDACDRGQRAQHWKVLSHDNDFFRFMNKTNGQCLHFQDPSAIPEQVEGQWWPCHGADSQVFRLIKDTKPVLHTAQTPLYAVNSSRCIQSQARALTYSSSSSEHLNYLHLPAKAISCDSHKKPVPKQMLFDYVEDFRGYLKIYDRYSGQCIVGGSDHSAFSSPCNQSNFSFWKKDEGPGGFRLINKATKQCLQLAQNGATQLASCNNHADQIFSYGFPKQKIEWEEVKSTNLRNVISGAQKRGNKINIFNAGLRLPNGSYSNAEIICHVERGNRDQRIGRLIDSGECLYAAYTKDYKMIQNKNSQLCFNIKNSSRESSAQLNQQDCASQDNQLYSLDKENNSDEHYTVHPKHSEKCLSVQDASKENGSLIKQWDCLHQDNQRWLIRKDQATDKYYQFIAKHSGKCMNAKGMSKNRAEVIQQWDCIDKDNQSYAFIYPRASRFKILKQASSSQWIKASGYTVPIDVLALGYYQGSEPIYACRVFSGNKIYVGWAKDHKCYAVVENKKEEQFISFTEFEYLTAD